MKSSKLPMILVAVLIFGVLSTIVIMFYMLHTEVRVASYSKGQRTGYILELKEQGSDMFRGSLSLGINGSSLGSWHFCLAGKSAKGIAETMYQAMKAGRRCIVSDDPILAKELGVRGHLVVSCELAE